MSLSLYRKHHGTRPPLFGLGKADARQFLGCMLQGMGRHNTSMPALALGEFLDNRAYTRDVVKYTNKTQFSAAAGTPTASSYQKL